MKRRSLKKDNPVKGKSKEGHPEQENSNKQKRLGKEEN